MAHKSSRGGSLNAIASPSLGLLVKLGSMIVHAEEFVEPGGHEFDLHTFKQLRADPEVAAWMEQMNRSALLPKKRSSK